VDKNLSGSFSTVCKVAPAGIEIPVSGRPGQGKMLGLAANPAATGHDKVAPDPPGATRQENPAFHFRVFQLP
jgi:hypothetical protein